MILNAIYLLNPPSISNLCNRRVHRLGRNEAVISLKDLIRATFDGMKCFLGSCQGEKIIQENLEGPKTVLHLEKFNNDWLPLLPENKRLQ